MAKFSSPVEVGARLTSKFAPSRVINGVRAPHAGDDYAPRIPGSHVPIYAITDGVVEAAGVGVLAGHTGNIVVLDHGMIGGDRTKTNYGHLSRIDVKKGQKVVAGQQIGLMGNSGRAYGVHLHAGTRFNGKYYSTDQWLRRKGIIVGKNAPLTTGKSTAKAPAKSKDVVDTKTLQTRLKKMGYHIVVDGKRGNETIKTIKMYQGSQKAPFKLVADGNWGAKTEAHYKWVIKLQTTLNKQKTSLRKLSVDGHYGANTVLFVKDIQKRNKAYKGVIDGIPGKMFCKVLGIATHP